MILVSNENKKYCILLNKIEMEINKVLNFNTEKHGLIRSKYFVILEVTNFNVCKI